MSARYVSMESDASLIDRTLNGDLDSFEDLVERYRDVVFRVAARIVGRDDAADVSQDAFLRAFHRLSGYKGKAPFGSWLLQITQNVALDDVARRQRQPAAVLTEDDPAPDRDPHRQPVSELERLERQHRLELKLDMLRPDYRSLLVLRDLEELPYEEIAHVLDMPLGSVKGRLHRARAELIELLRKNTYDWELPA